ncbi:hypothetical protein M406DRAFT_321077 [Cryphonectria parasitica EP155]|uniref:Uncharacterized protein n=1 Tax=Cryphonectria parasitica (strain ATCC 38755 / EP155) TaxID=660469 RepID=A0A9P5CST1_CRYP1|nr:uncharacterized protein M406DRAFT_321077 [Cryphonectria parasitica EP155]KAF3768947.1 hypothetical protein M406DRAFT_321077 [Cryphonectria parasitica EP155]
MAAFDASTAALVVLPRPVAAVDVAPGVPEVVVVPAGAAVDVDAGAEVAAPLNRVDGAVADVVAGVVDVAGLAPNKLGAAAVLVGALVAGADEAAAAGVVAENREGFEAGAELPLAGVEPSVGNRVEEDGAVLAAVLVAGAIVAAGLVPKRGGVLVLAVGSAGLAADAVPPKRFELDEVPPVEAPNRLPAGF